MAASSSDVVWCPHESKYVEGLVTLVLGHRILAYRLLLSIHHYLQSEAYLSVCVCVCVNLSFALSFTLFISELFQLHLRSLYPPSPPQSNTVSLCWHTCNNLHTQYNCCMELFCPKLIITHKVSVISPPPHQSFDTPASFSLSPSAHKLHICNNPLSFHPFCCYAVMSVFTSPRRSVTCDLPHPE